MSSSHSHRRKAGVGSRPNKDAGGPDEPALEVSEAPVGRETLHVIHEELRGAPAREPLHTMGYDEVPLDAIAAKIQRDPVITVGATRPGFETLAVIDQELGREMAEQSSLQPKPRPAPSASQQPDILELLTFVILDKSLSPSASEQQQRAFVAERLWHRLPPGGISAVRKIEVRRADDEAVLMRVWCEVPKLLR